VPHLVLERVPDLGAVAGRLAGGEPLRWGRAVLKTEGAWRRTEREALLVEGVVVELGRPLHPVALLAPRRERLVVRLWPHAPVERTPAVQRWLATVAAGAAAAGAGGVVATNLPETLWRDLVEDRRDG